MGLLEPTVHRKTAAKKKTSKKKTGTNPSVGKKRPKTKTAKRKPSKKGETNYPGSIWKVKSEAAKKGWVTRKKNEKKANKK